MKKVFTLLLFVARIAASMAQSCSPLDPGFGVNGKALGLSTNNDWLQGKNILVQPDNKIIQVSSTYTQFNVLRYKSNGQPDSTFGINGRLTYNPEFGMYYNASSAALQSNGKIVVVGIRYSSVNYYKDIMLVRFNSDGTPDNTFGSGGMVVTPASAYNDEANSIAIQPDGKIIVAGYISNTCFTDCNGNWFCMPALSVLRYDSNGVLDATFGQNGTSIIPSNNINGGRATQVIIQPDGKIVATGDITEYYCDWYYGGGYNTTGLLMARFDSQGKLDSTFGLSGIVRETNGLIYASGMVVQPDGKLVITGGSVLGGGLTKRYHGNGKPDNSFVSAVLNGWMNAITLNNDGKIILAGSISNSYGSGLLIARLNGNGTFDSSFSGDGQWYLRNNSVDSNNYATGVAIQQGKIIVGGLGQYFNSINNTIRYDQFAMRLKEPTEDILVSITHSGSLYPCFGQSVLLSTHQQGNFQWYYNGQSVFGANDSAFNATASGTYSVRVIDGTKCGESAEVPILYNSLPVSIIPGGGLNICNGDSVKLMSSESGVLQWFKDGFQITGATDTVYIAKSSGEYSVGVKNSDGCGISSVVLVNLNPEQPFINWDGTYLQTIWGYYDYQWFRNGQAIPGINAEIYQPTDTGVYKVVIADYGCNNASYEFNLNCATVSTTTPVIGWDGSRLFTASGYSGYQWYLNGNSIAGADTSFFQPVELGIYKVVGTGMLSCPNSSIDFNFSCDIAAPFKPALDWNGTQFITGTGYGHYQWYRNDTAISGATSNTYTPGDTEFGNYKVVVTSNFNCSKSSDPKPYWITASNDLVLADASLRYYPNPVSNTLFIDVTMQSNRKIISTLYDLSGKRIRQQLLKQGRNQMQLEHLSSGMYQLAVQYGVERKVVKVVVVR